MTGPFEVLPSALVEDIAADALQVLSRIGVAVHNEAAVALLAEGGAAADTATGRVRLRPELVERALGSAPPVVRLFDAVGRQTHEIGGTRQYFAPGSAAPTILDPRYNDVRPPTTADYVEYVKVVSALPHLAAQSTAFIPADVPAPISDSYRLYLSLLYGDKPVVTGTFSADGFAVVKDLQLAMRGSSEALIAQPLAVLTCCPTSPLSWSDDSASTLVSAARSGIPVEIVPMPLAGFIAPVRLAQTLVQHAAEALSGIVIAQLARPGAPVLYGTAATIFDVRYETTPVAAVEGMLLAAGAAQVGRHFRLPTQAYMALSDAKTLDAQAGLESAMGATLAAVTGVNQISGPGLLEFVNCFSLRKLIVDHEICAMALRLRDGIVSSEASAVPVLEELLRDGHLLIASDTRQHLRRHVRLPGRVIDRMGRQRWLEEGSRALTERAGDEIAGLIHHYEPPQRDEALVRALTARMEHAARQHGMDRLPER